MNGKQKKTFARVFAAAAMMIALRFFAPADRLARFALYIVPYLTVGYDILLKALKGIRNGQVFDENFLMVVATLGALALAVSGGGDYVEAVAVMLFYQTGELFQSIAVGKSRRSISALMDIRPDYANVEREGRLVQVDPDEVEIGTVIVVRPGEKVPIDGVVVSGDSSLDTAALTGESVPRTVGSGDAILSGCVNMTGLLSVRTVKEFGESTVSKILDLVENASSRKSKSEEFITKFACVYTPAVCGSALALALLPPAGRALFGLAPLWGDWVYRALTFLVISCPCALVVSIPLSFFAGLGGASRAGVLVKGSNFLETLACVTTVAFDKTGTLTRGVFEVTGVHHAAIPREKLLEYAALAESSSPHPISASLRAAYGGEIDRSRVTNVHEYGGEGVVADVDGVRVAAGNGRLMGRIGVRPAECRSVGTIVHIAVGGNYAGHIVISDVVRDSSAEAIRRLNASGVKRTVMLTGDRAPAAREVARVLGISDVRAELLPSDKVTVVEELLKRQKAGEKLAFVGDGINDAPVLSRADIGIAMGAMGSDAAIEAADVVLMDDDPLKIATAIRVSRKCRRIVRQNTWFAIGVKLLCLAAGALGIANMWLAVFADVGVMVLAVLNAVRALFVKGL